MRRTLDPFDELRDEMLRDIRSLGVRAQSGVWYRASSWQPLVDVVVTRDRAWVRMEVAGVAEEDLEIEITYNVVVVRGVRRPPPEHAGRGFHRAEIAYGAFERRIDLPWRARPAEEGAVVRHGVLDLYLERIEGGVHPPVLVRIGKGRT